MQTINNPPKNKDIQTIPVGTKVRFDCLLLLLYSTVSLKYFLLLTIRKLECWPPHGTCMTLMKLSKKRNKKTVKVVEERVNGVCMCMYMYHG